MPIFDKTNELMHLRSRGPVCLEPSSNEEEQRVKSPTRLAEALAQIQELEQQNCELSITVKSLSEQLPDLKKFKIIKKK